MKTKMIKQSSIIFVLILLTLNYSKGQDACSIDSLEWKEIQTIDYIVLEGIRRIDDKENNTIKKFWYNAEIDNSIGKCTVSFSDTNFVIGLNSEDNFNISDTIVTPFLIYYQNGLTEKPQSGTWFDVHYFKSDTGEPVDWDWHTIVVMSPFRFGFQIFFQDNYFKSRMFIPSKSESSRLIKPDKENLIQNTKDGFVKGQLISEYDLSGLDKIQKRFFRDNLKEIKIQIEYEYVNKTNGY